MATNQQRMITQVMGNTPFEINVALQALQTQLDEIQGLRGRAQIFDRVAVSNPTVAGDALNVATFGKGGLTGLPLTTGVSGILPVANGGTGAATFIGGRGFLAGLGISNGAADAVNDIDIAVGEARSSDNLENLLLDTAITKQLDAAWAVGTGLGGLDTGAEASSTWYHVWLIKRTDTGVTDALFSLSASAPTMPASYTAKRRLGSVFNSAGSVITAFQQVGDRFRWSVPVADIVDTDPGTAAVTRTLSVPLGVVTFADISVGLAQSTTAIIWGLVTALDEADTTPSATMSNFGASLASQNQSYGQFSIKTNTSSAIRSRQAASAGAVVLRITTFGWIDRRDRDG